MTAIAACSRSPAARPRSTRAPASTGPTSSPRSPRRPPRRSMSAAALLDGEIVALDEKGNTGFSALQEAISRGRARPHPVPVRRARDRRRGARSAAQYRAQGAPRRLVGEGRPPVILYADHIVGKGEQLFEAMCEAGQEGIISKRADAPYRGTRGPRTGSRSNAPGARNSSSSAGRRATRRAAASAPCCSA